MAKFGSVKWQDEMMKTIKHKHEHGEEFSPQEKAFIPVQSKHLRQMPLRRDEIVTPQGVKRKEKLSTLLSNFHGTENWTKGFMGIMYTDGVMAFAKEGNASWCITDMSVILKMERKVNSQPFVSIFVKSNGEQVSVVYEDGNGNRLYKQDYKLSDLESGEYKFYYVDGVLMLSSEY